MNVCIVGSGNIAHALVVIIGSNREFNVSILTNNLEQTDKIKGVMQDKREIIGVVSKVSNNPEELVPDSDVILITVPAFARPSILNKIKPYVKNDCLIGALPGIGGFNEEVIKIFPNHKFTLFSAQRVPCIARIIRKGHSVDVALKDEVYVATNNSSVKDTLEKLFSIKVNLLDDFLEVNLSNSNPLLHSARLFHILEGYPDIITTGVNEPISFYDTWNDDSSKTLIEMDNEFMSLVRKLELKNIKTLLEHYEVDGFSEMTSKLSKTPAFQGIKLPMTKKDNKYYIDLESRYFTEDVDIGMKYILDKLNEYNIKSNVISQVYKNLISVRL